MTAPQTRPGFGDKRRKKPVWQQCLEAVPLWSQIGALGESRAVRSSYIWLFVVPVLANLLQAAGPTISLPLPSRPFVLTLALPFNLTLFYGAALAFAGGSMLYSLGCPSFVRVYDSYSAFDESGKSDDMLLNAFAKLYQHTSLLWPLRLGDGLRDHFLTQYTDFSGNPDILVRGVSGTPSAIVSCNVKPEQRASAFWFVSHNSNRSYPLGRGVAVLCFLIGFLLLGWVLLQNARTVWRLSQSIA